MNFRLPKQLLILLLIGAASLGLFACGSSGDKTSTAGTSTAESTASETSSAGSNGKEDVNHGQLPLPVKGGSYDEEHPGTAQYGSPPLPIEADPGGAPAFTQKTVTAKEGNVTIEFTNPTSTPQNLTVELLPSHEKETTETIQEGFDAFTLTLNRKTKYVYYSSIPGMRKAGMEGEIKVTP